MKMYFSPFLPPYGGRGHPKFIIYSHIVPKM